MKNFVWMPLIGSLFVGLGITGLSDPKTVLDALGVFAAATMITYSLTAVCMFILLAGCAAVQR